MSSGITLAGGGAKEEQGKGIQPQCQPQEVPDKEGSR